MTHLFDVDVAIEHGVDVAIMVQNFAFWINKNMADNRNYFDDSYWTYTSTRALVELFPYWTENQVRRIIKAMVDKGIVRTGNYNQQKYDRTTWYSFTDAFLQKHKSIFTKAQMEVGKITNGSERKHETIPDSSTVLSTDNNRDIHTNETCQEITDYYNNTCTSLPKVIKLSDKRKTAIRSLLKDYSIDEVKSALDKVESSPFLIGSDGGWKANFDWLMNKNNLLKVLEGNYDSKQKHKGSREGYDLDLSAYTRL